MGTWTWPTFLRVHREQEHQLKALRKATTPSHLDPFHHHHHPQPHMAHLYPQPPDSSATGLHGGPRYNALSLPVTQHFGLKHPGPEILPPFDSFGTQKTGNLDEVGKPMSR